jgi:hypothetical protein
MLLPFPKFSLLSWNAGGNLDASSSMYIVLVVLKISSLSLYNYLSFAFYFLLLFLFSILPPSCLLFSHNWSKALIASFSCNKNVRKYRVKKWKDILKDMWIFCIITKKWKMAVFGEQCNL